MRIDKIKIGYIKRNLFNFKSNFSIEKLIYFQCKKVFQQNLNISVFDQRMPKK